MHRLTLARLQSCRRVGQWCRHTSRSRTVFYSTLTPVQDKPVPKVLEEYRYMLQNHDAEVWQRYEHLQETSIEMEREDFDQLRLWLWKKRPWGCDEKVLRVLNDMKSRSQSWGQLEYNEFFKANLYQGGYQEILQCYHNEVLPSGLKLNSSSFNVLLATYIILGKDEEATKLVKEANQRWGVVPDVRDFDRLIRRCLPLQRDVYTKGRALVVEHAFADVKTLDQNLVHLFREGRAEDCMWIYEREKDQRTIHASTYSILISGFVDARRVTDAVRIYQAMRLQDLNPDRGVCSHMLTVYAHKRDVRAAEHVVRDTAMAGHVLDITIYSQLIRVYFKARELRKALKAFETVQRDPSLQVNTILLNTMIDGLVINNEVDTAKLFYQQMLQAGICPDLVTVNTLLKGFMRQGEFTTARELVKDMGNHGLKPDTVTFTTLIDAVFLGKKPAATDELVRYLGEAGVEPNIFTFNAMINGWVVKDRMDEAEKTLQLMKSPPYRIRPTIHTYTNLIQGYAKAMNLNMVVKTFRDLQTAGIEPDRATFNMIIDVHISHERLEDAISYLSMMLKMHRSPTTDTWRILMNECVRKQDWVAGAKVIRALDASDFRIKSDKMANAYTILKRCINAGVKPTSV